MIFSKEKACLYCGKVFIAKITKDHNERKCCSANCYNALRKGRKRDAALVDAMVHTPWTAEMKARWDAIMCSFDFNCRLRKMFREQ